MDALFGLYSSGILHTAVTMMLVSVEQGNCEPNEGYFKYIKKCFKTARIRNGPTPK